jgi:serpin B
MLLWMLLACGDEDEQLDMEELADAAPTAEVVEAPVGPAPVVDVGAPGQVAASINAFAFDLLGQIDGQTVFSPASISLAFVLLEAGAGGASREGLNTVFHLPETPQSAFGAWQNRVNGIEGVRLANRLWAQQGLELNEDYAAGLKSSLGAEVGRVDFTSGGRDEVNAWVSEQTEDKIPELLREGTVGPATRLVLTNAVYFLGAWQTPFDKALTAPAVFHAPEGEVDVPTMRQLEWMPYYEGDGVQAVRLPYEEGVSAVVVLADEAPTLASFATLTSEMRNSRVELSLPRFELRWQASLKAPLSALGLGGLFADGADLSGISDEPLLVDDCVHEAWMRVDEKGTEAAAATGILVKATSIPPPPMVMTVDRPFHFVVVDDESGAILFVARVENPDN